jgi:hypothetical protein
LLHDLFGNLLLATHRIQADPGTVEVQQLQ